MKFNLSSKEHIHWGTEPAYAKEDVKEFIKLLKEEFRKDIIIDDFMVSIKEIDNTINKLAGKELI